MNRPELIVLDGGRSLPVSKMHRVYLDGYVTNTRLMGVLAVCARWEIVSPTADRDDPDSWEELNQFIYIDCEEAGFETYQQIRGYDDPETDRIEEALVCGLGGRKIELTERQLRLLLQNWARFNHEHDLPLPPGIQDYGFLLDPAVDADEAEQYALMQMICAPIRSDLEAVNYFLMRCFGRDHEGARYLADPAALAAGDDSAALAAGDDSAALAAETDQLLQEHPAEAEPLRLDLYDRFECATFCRNAIDRCREFDDGSVQYRCESLIEMDGIYETIISLVTVRERKVTGLTYCSSLPVTDTEAAMILKKAEYITVYEIFLSDDELEANLDEFTLGFHTTMSEYENGLLFMSFRPTNDHVNRDIFVLSNDVRGMYFLTNNRQLILCAYNAADLHYLEHTVAGSVLAPYFIPSGHYKFIPGGGYRPDTGHYEFREPVLYEFMQSDFEHFEDFLQTLYQE